jgi:hypothetical protein
MDFLYGWIPGQEIANSGREIPVLTRLEQIADFGEKLDVFRRRSRF